MEDTVPTLRIVTTSAVFLTLAAGSASAQTATTTAPGKPLPLLQIFQKNEETATVTPHHRARYARRRATRTRVANHTGSAMRHAFMEVQPSPEPAQPEATQPTTMRAAATTAAPANIWPTPDFTLPGTKVLTATPMAAPLVDSQPTGPTAAPNPNEVLAAAYHTVQVAPQVASAAQVIPPNTVRVAQANTVSSTDAVADPPHEATSVAKASLLPTGPVQRAMVAAVEPQNPNPVGSPTWIVHVLAALGGAIAAGGVAWFLINPLPARRYQ
jgi:hypothetical protein